MEARFFASRAFAVAGASADRSKFGNKVLRWYLERGLAVTPVNPRASSIEGVECATTLAALGPDTSVSVVTPPAATEQLMRDAARLGIRHLWLQPGSEPAGWQALATELGLETIGGGPCVLVEGGQYVQAQL
ncbi:hypothetical protein H4R19_002860 [Coemansia spiralis]|nr:hypothetical protein H4R19_002860 [Coemansia spiralis]